MNKLFRRLRCWWLEFRFGVAPLGVSRYRLRPVPVVEPPVVAAIRWTPDNYDEVRAFLGDRARPPFPVVPHLDALLIDCTPDESGKTCFAFLYNYIVFGPEGISIYGDGWFHRLYEPIDKD